MPLDVLSFSAIYFEKSMHPCKVCCMLPAKALSSPMYLALILLV